MIARRSRSADPLHDQLRPDLGVAADMVDEGSRVLDLGCGDGTLLRHMIDYHRCRGTGVEIDAEQVVRALRRGVSVIELDVDEQLRLFYRIACHNLAPSTHLTLACPETHHATLRINTHIAFCLT